MIVLNLSYFVSILNFSGLKSSKLTNFAGAAHNVLSIFKSFTSFSLYYTFVKYPSLIKISGINSSFFSMT